MQRDQHQLLALFPPQLVLVSTLMGSDLAPEVLNLKGTALEEKKSIKSMERSMLLPKSESGVLGTKFIALIKVNACYFGCFLIQVLCIKSFTGFSYEYNNISIYIGNQGFLNMLKQKFLKSSNRGTDYDAGGSLHRPGKLQCRKFRCMDHFEDENNTKNLLVTNLGNLNATNATNSANVTPEMTRREYAPEMRNESGVR